MLPQNKRLSYRILGHKTKIIKIGKKHEFKVKTKIPRLDQFKGDLYIAYFKL